MTFDEKNILYIEQAIEDNLPLNTWNAAALFIKGIGFYVKERKNPCFQSVSILGTLEFIATHESAKKLFQEISRKHPKTYKKVINKFYTFVIDENRHFSKKPYG